MKKLSSIFVLALLTTLLTAQVSKTVNVTTAGTLTTLLTSTEKTTVTNLTVTGNIDVRDVKYMRDEMTKLAVLDIGGVYIKSYYGSDGTYFGNLRTYPANQLPMDAFYNGVDNISKLSLKSIILPTSINSIGDDAFVDCKGLTGTFYIPNSITSIGQQAFYLCSSLTNFAVNTDNSIFTALDGVLFNKTMTSILLYPPGKLGNYVIPNSVTSIGKDAFNGSDLESVSIPNLVTSIGDCAFYGCNSLTGTFTLPPSLTTIGSGAFYGCSGIKIINCLGTPPIIGSDCFTYTNSITDVFVPTDAAVASYKANAGWFSFFPGNVIKKSQPSEILQTSDNDLRVYPANLEIIIDGTAVGETVTLYSVVGKQMQTVMSKGERIILPVDKDAVYLVKTRRKTFKVIL